MRFGGGAGHGANRTVPTTHWPKASSPNRGVSEQPRNGLQFFSCGGAVAWLRVVDFPRWFQAAAARRRRRCRCNIANTCIRPWCTGTTNRPFRSYIHTLDIRMRRSAVRCLASYPSCRELTDARTYAPRDDPSGTRSSRRHPCCMRHSSRLCHSIRHLGGQWQ